MVNVHINDDFVIKELKKLKNRDPKEFRQLRLLIYALESEGASLTRPQAAPVRDGIFELRPQKHRLLYKIVGAKEAVLLVLCKKSGSKVSTKDFDLAKERLERYSK